MNKENMLPKTLEKAIKKYEKLNKRFDKFNVKVKKTNSATVHPEISSFRHVQDAYEATESLKRFYGSMSIVGIPEDGSTPIEFIDHLPDQYSYNWDSGHMRHIPPDLLLYLSQYDTGHWENDDIDFIFSGKDADLLSSVHGVSLNGYIIEEGSWYLQCFVCFYATLARSEKNSKPSPEETSTVPQLLPDEHPSYVTEDSWHTSGEEAILISLDKPHLMAEKIYEEAYKVMNPIHEKLDAARNYLEALEESSSEDDETLNNKDDNDPS